MLKNLSKNDLSSISGGSSGIKVKLYCLGGQGAFKVSYEGRLIYENIFSTKEEFTSACSTIKHKYDVTAPFCDQPYYYDFLMEQRKDEHLYFASVECTAWMPGCKYEL